MGVIICDSKSKVDALRECIDLKRNGYLQMFLVDVNSVMIGKYKHQRNGRTLIVTANKEHGKLQEGDRILKEW